MNMAERIQNLRKSRAISQEDLAEKLGVSRQAVSKWESEQSSPDLEKVILMSELFDTTTDYILKGIDPIIDEKQKSNELTSKILYIASTAFIAIGIFCAFGRWWAEQTMESVFGSMIIQAVGVVVYFIGRLLSPVKPSLYVSWLNIIGLVFMPVSLFTGYFSILIFKQGWVAPYPIGLTHALIFGVIFGVVAVMSFIILKKRTK